MHLGIFLHVSQMVRRGYAARFGEPDIIDRRRLVHTHTGASPPIGDLDPTHFRGKRITLLAAEENHLWHRDAVDLMYEWLWATGSYADRQRYEKRVFAGYNLQELLWGARAPDEVYPVIAEALRPEAMPTPRSRTPPSATYVRDAAE
jgi:hypothetical protein